MNLSEIGIQRKIQDGDIREFEKLFIKYYSPLCFHAYKIVNDMAVSEDLVQDFFYNFWKNRQSFVLKFSLSAYMYQSVKNNAVHYLEHLKVRKVYAGSILNDTVDTGLEMQASTLEVSDLKKIVDKTLKKMPERCAVIFSLNRFEGLTYNQIADKLSVSVKTVEADMTKALKMFRESLYEFLPPGIARGKAKTVKNEVQHTSVRL